MTHPGGPARHGSGAALPVIVVVAALIGWIAPFDRFYMALTSGSPVLRALVIAGVATVGGLVARRAGLRLEGHGAGAPLRTGLIWAAGVAAWVLLLDCFVFRDRLAPAYEAFLHQPLFVRLPYFMLRAFNENVLYRLFAFGSLVWLVQRWRGTRLPVPALLALAATVQAVNIGANVAFAAGAPPLAGALGYDVLRYVAPGVAWAWLFVRHGFATAEVASVGCHLFLQPAFTLFLDR